MIKKIEQLLEDDKNTKLFKKINDILNLYS